MVDLIAVEHVGFSRVTKTQLGMRHQEQNLEYFIKNNFWFFIEIRDNPIKIAERGSHYY